jgi:hypothetical protein
VAQAAQAVVVRDLRLIQRLVQFQAQLTPVAVEAAEVQLQ